MTREPFSDIIVFPENVKARLRKPLGLLLRGRPNDVRAELPNILSGIKPSQVIAVGDITSGMLLESGVRPSLMVVDNRVERRSYYQPTPGDYAVVRVKNPAGTITPEAAAAICRSIERGENTLVLVDGEEDLLALPAIYYMPDDAVLLYGQPGEGCVLVRGGSAARRMVEEILGEVSRRT